VAILLMRYSEIGLKGIKVRNNWENRLKQEILLGIGGMLTLEALGIRKEEVFYFFPEFLDHSGKQYIFPDLLKL
jgi:adenylyl- and sulfurtransferase ThiI